MDIIRRKKTNKVDNERQNFLEQKYQERIKDTESEVYDYSFSRRIDNGNDEYFNSNENRGNEQGAEKSLVNEDEETDNHNYQASDFFEEGLDIDEREDTDFDRNDIKGKNSFIDIFLVRKLTLTAIILLTFFISGGYLFFNKSEKVKKQVLGVSDEAYDNIDLAINGIKNQDFALSINKFNEAYKNFSEISNSLKSLGTGTIRISEFVPGASKLSSGYYLSQAGGQLALAGKKVSQVAQTFSNLKKGKINFNNSSQQVSLLNIFQSFKNNLKGIKIDLIKAQKNLEQVKIKDLPKDKQANVADLKNKLIIVIDSVNVFLDNSYIITDLLGANGPRKYLFLLQNNQEMRATGGFIGSYGILNIDSAGRIQNFFIDGIFNPDGQLVDKIVPPKPIQKISTAWSLHDSNWFPDFPLSARKAMLFYEKTGGATVDGVITITPTVMQKLLTITGPVEMKEYDVVLTADNFIQNIQYEVEEDYDKDENKPKKILSDLTPIVLSKIFSTKDAKTIAKTVAILNEALSEKQILLYSSNDDLQKIISKLGWSGEILQTQGDYLSIINTNINGYKTDGVVDESIEHQINISDDGSIVDTVSITRKHNGGNEKYMWWNKVNADYMRVYVPRGSKLLEVEGQTRESDKSPVDYNALGFEKDKDVEREESNMKIDEATGTRVYDESGKTVFGNWVYVSPQEKVTIRYKYLLPFKISFSEETPGSSYSILIQKQAGSFGSDYSLQINYPKKYRLEWRNDNLETCSSSGKDNKIETQESVCFKTKLDIDNFSGLVLSN